MSSASASVSASASATATDRTLPEENDPMLNSKHAYLLRFAVEVSEKRL